MVSNDVVELLVEFDVVAQHVVDSLVRFGQFVMELARRPVTTLLQQRCDAPP